MSATLTPILAYGVPIVVIWSLYIGLKRRGDRRARTTLAESVKAGLTEPASLHPKIDLALCRGCGTCVAACPEGRILGLIDGKATLVEPTRCIGHAACATACPFDAITLVFGTEKRGVDIPHVEPDFQTNVPGIFIAGELGGMGLIRNAIEQGRQAMEGIANLEGLGHSKHLDVVIVGAGPAGFSASLGAMERGLRFVTIEQDSLGGTVAQFPRGKLVMTAPATLPLYGKMQFRETRKETLLAFWEDVKRKTGLEIHFGVRVETVEPLTPAGGEGGEPGFEVRTTNGSLKTRTVLLAIGRRGTPRKLGVPGEDLTKVVYRLIDPEQYREQHVLVVGGGDAALEAATSIAEEPGTTVTLSYRNKAFSRAKAKNRAAVEKAEHAGRLNVLLGSNVKEIAESHVVIEDGGERIEIANDGIIICAGGILPTGFLKTMGIEVETKHGTA